MRRPLAIGALLLVLLVGAGCGGGDGKKSSLAHATPAKHRRPTPAEARDIRGTIAQLEGAIDRDRAGAVCDLYTKDARLTATESYASCDTAVRSDLEGEKPARLSVGRIDVSWDPAERPRSLQASVAVTSTAAGREPIDVDAVLILEDGSWRIDDSVLDYLVKPKSDSGPAGGGED
jgi:hypothetical protein